MLPTSPHWLCSGMQRQIGFRIARPLHPPEPGTRDEATSQAQRRILKAAAFRDLKTLEDFDWSFNPRIPRSQMYDLATGKFIKQRRDVLFCSPPGTGKSHLVQAIGYQLIKLGYIVLYRSIFDVVRDFLHDEAMDGHDRVMARYLKPDLLIIDDLFEIVMRRYETRSTIMTTNRPVEDWGELLRDVPTATAILDRFLHHAEIISVTGDSYRLRDRQRARQAANRTKAPTGSKTTRKTSKRTKAPTGSDAENTDRNSNNH